MLTLLKNFEKFWFHWKVLKILEDLNIVCVMVYIGLVTLVRCVMQSIGNMDGAVGNNNTGNREILHFVSWLVTQPSEMLNVSPPSRSLLQPSGGQNFVNESPCQLIAWIWSGINSNPERGHINWYCIKTRKIKQSYTGNIINCISTKE